MAGRDVVLATDLDEGAGQALRASGDVGAAIEDMPESPLPEPLAIEAALRAEHGNISRAAARLGVTRSWLRRFIERAEIDVEALRD